MANSKREALLAAVVTHLSTQVDEFGDCAEALEFESASPGSGIMQGPPVALVRFSESGFETCLVHPEQRRNAKFAIDEANDRVFVDYEKKKPLSGWGASWCVQLDGTARQLRRRRF